MKTQNAKPSDDASPNLKILGMKADLLDSLPECIFLVGADHSVLAVNATAESMLGVNVNAVLGHPVRDAMAPLTDSDGDPLEIDALIRRVLSKRHAELLDGWVSGGTGGDHGESGKVAVSILPSRSGSSEVTIVIGGEAARQPYGLRDAVLSMVSHELRTPLLHIKGFVSSLLESDIEWDEETRLDFLHTIDREADRLTSMVSDLMEISRMGSGDLPLHLEDADPYQLAYAAVDSASPFTHRHQVVVQVPENLPEIHIDVLRVMGVLVNLIENASKYSEEGTRITIDANSDGSSVTFSVTDNGSGIPEDAHDKIFSMFYRGDFAGKRSSGTGLGLAVCKAVTDAHKGDIWVESKPGSGSTFSFSIPIKSTRARVARKAVAKSSAGRVKRTKNGKQAAGRVKPAVKSKVAQKIN